LDIYQFTARSARGAENAEGVYLSLSAERPEIEKTTALQALGINDTFTQQHGRNFLPRGRLTLIFAVLSTANIKQHFSAVFAPQR